MSKLYNIPLGMFVLLSTISRPIFARNLFSINSIPKTDFQEIVVPACNVYCTGPLLHTVQMARLFEDSKTFVDMKLKFPPDQTLKEFNAFMESSNNTPSRDAIRDFVDKHFDDIGREFVEWIPDDWKTHPKFLDLIRDPDLKQWGADLNGIWKELGRKMIDDVFKNPDFYSIIPVDFPVIVPGGRFVEFYYWDSYWIVRGLLYSEMFSTVRGMLINFLTIVQRYGYIPNGGRIYYAKRSQPPLLTPMIKSYVEFTGDTQFGIDALEMLEHEFEYWMNNRTVQAKGYSLAAYSDDSVGPRPESYSEDVLATAQYPNDQAKQEHYSELRAAAESGMDFSSRWFLNANGTNLGNLTNLKTRSVIPVELNAILYWNAIIIAEFHKKAGNRRKVVEYTSKAEKIKTAIQGVLWNEDAGVWLDYDLVNNKPRNYFVPTNLAPLWTQAYNTDDTEKLSKKIILYLKDNALDGYPGGVPNTLQPTGEQWDFPNVWAPMQYILVEGLANLGTNECKNLSLRWASRWVRSNFEAYRKSQSMFEKYDAEIFGGYGGGGEYSVQKGFGWTNGVIIEFLSKYGKQISSSVNSSQARNVMGSITMAVILLVATVVSKILWN